MVSLTCLGVLAVTGVALSFWYDPSGDTVDYSGSYPLLRGLPVSRAYASTMHISFDVPGGLLLRQTHHWAALVLPAALILQMLATFFTGAFRDPRRLTWALLVGTFLLVLGAGWSGYALPDDMLAGTGLRIVEGIVLGIPVVGTRASFAFFGGEFPGTALTHMYWLHVAVLPSLVVVVVALRALAALRTPVDASDSRRVPLRVYAVRAAGLSLITTGFLVLLGGLVEVSPVWIYGPASSGHASAGSQPDWYTDFLDGALRLVPSGWEPQVLGHPLSLSVLVPQALVGAFIATILLWPFLEAVATGDRRRHVVLDRPREHPTRTALGVAGLVFFCGLWLAGATDVVTVAFGISFEHQVVALRTLVLLGPLVAFPVTRALCTGLTARELTERAGGIETGVILRDPLGGYTERHGPRPADPPALTGERRDT
ncbi:cytochrome bc complex cytochrome b subunit [Nocardioides anomalus]|uniref:Cytochrome bc1 complex cytochrome b subunit n=1 Tax=Nocardioides anomalus TaxID=2712223 RepID=A0A6G6WAI6_9ACTN|nr:cytochrome b N-terminal domain-containing protein [Nocardioides anomalus]QIG42050.1 cytochrome bc complex cytochrome b subunit [Nocardioides anomalus]